jgi:hypothetical protein
MQLTLDSHCTAAKQIKISWASNCFLGTFYILLLLADNQEDPEHLVANEQFRQHEHSHREVDKLDLATSMEFQNKTHNKSTLRNTLSEQKLKTCSFILLPLLQ